MGSTSLISDSTGAALPNSSVVYAPFGEIRQGAQSGLTDFGYTGQRLDGSTGGLMYYGARYYLPGLRRFISADTIAPNLFSAQALNRYSYVYNNPLKYTDPTGHFGIGATGPMIDGMYSTSYVMNHPNDIPECPGGCISNFGGVTYTVPGTGLRAEQDFVAAITQHNGNIAVSGGLETANFPLPGMDPDDRGDFAPIGAGNSGITCMFDAADCGGDEPTHAGLDFTLRNGEDRTVQPVYSGVVAGYAWDQGSWGHYVIVETPWYLIDPTDRNVLGLADGLSVYIVYPHMEYPAGPEPTMGDFVSQGQGIGTMGDSGGQAGVHLHLEVGVYVSGTDFTSYRDWNLQMQPVSRENLRDPQSLWSR